MGDSSGNSIINVGDISKPVNTFIKKIADATGVAFEPTRIVRKARAEAKAALIESESKIAVTDLEIRAMKRWVHEEAKKQENMEGIIKGAIPLIEDASNPETVDDDWITNFFDKSRLISDDEMQTLWSKVLAGEANQPGQYSKRTVNLLAGLDKNDAILFTKICGYIVQISVERSPFIENIENDIYKKNEIQFIDIQHLENLGLVNFNHISGFQINSNFDAPGEINGQLQIRYFDYATVLTKKIKNGEAISLGKVLFTRIGQELSQICVSKPVNGFEEYVVEKFIADGWVKKEYTTFGF